MPGNQCFDIFILKGLLVTTEERFPVRKPTIAINSETEGIPLKNNSDRNALIYKVRTIAYLNLDLRYFKAKLEHVWFSDLCSTNSQNLFEACDAPNSNTMRNTHYMLLETWDLRIQECFVSTICRK